MSGEVSGVTSQPDPKDGPPPDGVSLLREYLAHKPGCVRDNNSMTPRCSCGLLQVGTALLRVVPPDGGPREPTDTERLDWLSCHSPCPDWKPLTSLHRGQIDALMRAGGQPPSDGMPSEMEAAFREGFAWGWAAKQAGARDQSVADLHWSTSETRKATRQGVER